MVTNQEEYIKKLAKILRKISKLEDIGEQSFLRKIETAIEVLEDNNLSYFEKTPSIVLAEDLKARYTEKLINAEIDELVVFFENALTTKDLDDSSLENEIQEILAIIKNQHIPLEHKGIALFKAKHLKPEIKALINKKAKQ